MYKNYTCQIVEGSNIEYIYFENYSDHKKIFNLYGVNFQDGSLRTALMWACYKKNIEIVKLLLEDENINVNIRDNFGRTALMWACFGDNVEIFRLLLEVKNIDVNIRDNESRTALTWARHVKNNKTIKLLKNRGK